MATSKKAPTRPVKKIVVKKAAVKKTAAPKPVSKKAAAPIPKSVVATPVTELQKATDKVPHNRITARTVIKDVIAGKIPSDLRGRALKQEVYRLMKIK